MRILFVKRRNHTNFWPAFDALEEAGHEVFVTSVVQHANQLPSSREVLLRMSRIAKMREIQFLPPRMRALFSDYAGPDVRRAITEIEPDLVVVKGETKLLSIEAARFARSRKIPVLLYTQHPLNKQSPRVVRGLRRYVTKGRKWFTPVLGPTHGTPEDGGVYLPFCMAPQEAETRPRERSEPLNVLMLGQFHMIRKNHLPFLKVVDQLRNRMAMSVVVAGPGDERTQNYRDVVEFVRASELQDTVKIRNDVRYDSVGNLYRWAHLYVLPSDDEPAAVSIAEAMSFGLPVICNNSNATHCYFETGAEGLLFEKGEWGGLREAMYSLYEDDALRVGMGRRAKARSQREHAPEKWVARFEWLAAQAV